MFLRSNLLVVKLKCTKVIAKLKKPNTNTQNTVCKIHAFLSNSVFHIRRYMIYRYVQLHVLYNMQAIAS